MTADRKRLLKAPLPSKRVVSFEMPSRRAAVGLAVEKVLRSVSLAKLGLGRRQDLAVAVAEALSNAAVHGNGLRPRTKVAVRVESRSSGEVRVEVRDSGLGFDAHSLEDPTDPTHLLQPGGRGVFIMRRLVDEVTYNDAGNSVTLRMNPRPSHRPKKRR